MVTKTQPRTLTLPDLISRFIQSRHYLSPKTVDYYQVCLGGLGWFAVRQHWPDPDEITREHIRDFIEYVATEPHRWAGDSRWVGDRRCTFKKASAGTVHHYAKVAKTFFNWAEDEEYLEKSPTRRMKLPRPQHREVEPYSDEEVDAMLNVCEHDIQYRYRCVGIRNKAIISVFIDTGLRLSELAGMRLFALDPHLQQIRVIGKGAKLRVVPLNGEARKALKRYLTEARQPGGDEVWKTDDGQPLSPHSIKIMISRLKKRAGVNGGGGPHRFRHYFATRCLENGMDINSLRLLLGHATLYMVLRYTKFVNVKRALDEHHQFSPLDSLHRGGNHNRGNDGWGWRG